MIQGPGGVGGGGGDDTADWTIIQLGDNERTRGAMT